MTVKKYHLAYICFAIFSMAAKNSMAVINCEEHSQIAADEKRFPAKEDSLAYLESVKAECMAAPLFVSTLAGRYFYFGRIDEAEKLTLNALQRHPNHSGLLFRIGNVYLAREKQEEAKKIAEKIIKLYPQQDIGYYLMQRALMDSRKFSESISYGQKVIKYKNNSDAIDYLNMAVAAYHSDQFELCVTNTELAIKIDPNVLKKSYGINEAIYALDRLKRKREALALAKRRKDADVNWRNDEVLVRALKVMGVID